MKSGSMLQEVGLCVGSVAFHHCVPEKPEAGLLSDASSGQHYL